MGSPKSGYVTTTTSVLREVMLERAKQDAQWGVQRHSPQGWLPILGEEFGEVCRAVCEEGVENYREELIQTAAVCVAMVESFDSNPHQSFDRNASL